MMCPGSGPGPDFIHAESGVYSGPAPECILFLGSGPGSGYYQARPGPLVRIVSTSCAGPDPDVIKHVRFRVRILQYFHVLSLRNFQSLPIRTVSIISCPASARCFANTS